MAIKKYPKKTFWVTKKVPVKKVVRFKRSDGTYVRFKAKTIVKKPVKVNLSEYRKLYNKRFKK